MGKILSNKDYQQLIKLAFQEDAPQGDITSIYFGDKDQLSTAKLIAKAKGILCGINIFEECFKYIDRKTIVNIHKKDGSQLRNGEIVATIQGRTNSLLLAERTALNFLQQLSGISTATNKLVKVLRDTETTLLDTRKTTPGLRVLEKYAVVCGGGQNHRLDLSAMVLIKDNHLARLSEKQLLDRLKFFRKKRPGIKVEIEAATLQQVEKFLAMPVDIIMLDNMNIKQMKAAIKLRDKLKKSIPFEASGNISEKTILAVAQTGVEFISSGSITHSAPALDFSLLVD